MNSIGRLPGAADFPREPKLPLPRDVVVFIEEADDVVGSSAFTLPRVSSADVLNWSYAGSVNYRLTFQTRL
jgi:hypothetical protein